MTRLFFVWKKKQKTCNLSNSTKKKERRKIKQHVWAWPCMPKLAWAIMYWARRASTTFHVQTYGFFLYNCLVFFFFFNFPSILIKTHYKKYFKYFFTKYHSILHMLSNNMITFIFIILEIISLIIIHKHNMQKVFKIFDAE